jgi:HSP20 family protein
MRWDPYRELSTLQDRFSRFFEPTLGRRGRDEEVSLGAWAPPVDIAEDHDRITISAELPGFREDQIEIQTENGTLTLRGERRFEKETEGKSWHRVERAYGQFVRSFSLPNNVDPQKIRARFDDGVLEIELPKREDARPKTIKIIPGSEKKAGAIDVAAK